MLTDVLSKHIKCHYYELPSAKGLIGLHVLMPISGNIKDYCFFLPGRWQNSLIWAYNDPKRDFRICLSLSGYAVITLDYVTHFNNPNNNLQNILEDYGIVDFILVVETGIKFIESYYSSSGSLIGFSFGAALSFLAQSNATIQSWTKRLVVFDGGIKDPNMQKKYNLQERLKSEGSILLENPSSDKYFSKYANSSQSTFILNGRLQDQDFKKLIINGDRWWPNKVIVELKAIADYEFHPELTIDSTISQVECPIISFYPLKKEDVNTSHRTPFTLSFTKSKNIVCITLDNCTHMEVIFGLNSKKNVFIPLLNWLDQGTNHGH